MSGEPIGRLKDRKPGGSSPEDKAGELLRAAGRAPALAPQQLERLWGRLAPGLPGAAGAVASLAGWKLMLAGALAVGGAVALGFAQREAPPPAPASAAEPESVQSVGVDSESPGTASSKNQRGLERTGEPTASSLQNEAGKPGRESLDSEAHAGRLEVRDDREAPPRSDPAERTSALASSPPSMVALVAPARRDAAARSPTTGGPDAAASPSPAVAEGGPDPSRPAGAVEPGAADALAAESGLVRRAVEKLRVERDAAAALGILDDYQARFPNGVFANEARFARIDALLVLGRRAEALEVLEKAGLGELPRHGELRVLRGELLAEAGRCREAVEAFTRELDSGLTGSLAERSLHGRAICRGILGDRAGSRADSLLYLERHPQGQFAGEVRQALGE